MSDVTVTLSPVQAMAVQAALNERIARLARAFSTGRLDDFGASVNADMRRYLEQAYTALDIALYGDAPESADPITASKAASDLADHYAYPEGEPV